MKKTLLTLTAALWISLTASHALEVENRTPWKIGLTRFREKLAKGPLVMNISPFAPIVEVVDNLLVNSGGVDMALPKSPMLVGNFQVTAPPVDGKEKGFVSSITILPEYTAWVEAGEKKK